jgi:hypothetical protein
MIDTATDDKTTAVGPRLINPRSAFSSASASIQNLHKFHDGVFIVDDTETSMLGTTLYAFFNICPAIFLTMLLQHMAIF